MTDDLFPDAPLPRRMLIDCVQREINLRVYVYPARVAAKRMTQKKADIEIRMMREVLKMLKEQP